jgi:hypothetical protein
VAELPVSVLALDEAVDDDPGMEIHAPAVNIHCAE